MKKKMSLICLQIDLARQKESISYVKEYLDNAKRWGYNAVLLYLENAVRTPSTSFFSEEDTYSMAEMGEIVAHAKSLSLQLIPAFENLGHLEKFFAYPALQDFAELHDGEQGRGFSREPYGNCGCVCSPRLYEVMNTYIAEVSSLFDGEYIHMGLDEPFDFAVCQQCREKLASGVSKADMFYEHVMKSYALVKSLGKCMMMWDDFFEYADIVEKLPRDIIFCNWNYSFVGVEPSGHWTNRIKKDWFRLYEKLGFEYLLCVYAHRSSATYNVDSFTRYASKYNPLGGLCTVWERSTSLYLNAYPFMAYTAKLWQGQVCDEEEKLAIYEAEIGDRELARLVLSLNVPAFYGEYTDVGNMSEHDYFLRRSQTATIAYAVEKMRPLLCSDVSVEIFNNVYEHWLELRLAALGVEIFNQIEEGRREPASLLREIDEIAAGYEEIEGAVRRLWEKYRKGIASANGALDKKYAGKKASLAALRERLLQEEKSGVFYLDTMLHDGYCTVRGEIRAKYEGEEKARTLYNGGMKPSYTGYEVGGVYGFRFRMEDKKLDYALLSVYGEGALYPLHLRYLAGGTLYEVERVEVVEGKVLQEENLRFNDTRFAQMGYDDGVAHFNDLELAKQRHTVRVYFKAF